MFILGVFSWRRRPACSLLAACMQGVDAGVQGVDPGMQGVDALHTASTPEYARVFQWRRLHLKRNAACMHPACRLHAGCCNLQPPAYDRMQAACSLHAACMQPACISSVALALGYSRTNQRTSCITYIHNIYLQWYIYNKTRNYFSIILMKQTLRPS